MIRAEDNLPFDIQGSRTIYFNLHDLDEVETTKKRLSNQVKSIGSEELDNPITISFDISNRVQAKNQQIRF